MSHDRGCSCGREPYEYNTCPNSDCHKRSDIIEDTDWRPSPCPVCGEMREAARNPVCNNSKCQIKIYAERSNIMERDMKTEKQYLWVKEDRAPMFVTDLIALYKDREFDPNADKIYEIGPEVKLELNVKVTPAKPVYRKTE